MPVLRVRVCVCVSVSECESVSVSVHPSILGDMHQAQGHQGAAKCMALASQSCPASRLQGRDRAGIDRRPTEGVCQMPGPCAVAGSE